MFFIKNEKHTAHELINNQEVAAQLTTKLIVIAMKTSLSFILIFAFLIKAQSQNLVPDPSFENSGCATGNIRLPWQRPTGSTTTPDLFNVCGFPSTASCASKGIPINMGGSTNPAHSGNAYAGIVDVYDLGAPNGREYLQVRLTSPLAAGQRYNIGFWILRPDSTKYATNGKGMYLSSSQTPQAGNQFINVVPQVVSGVVSDANNWTLVSGIYTASGGEEWLTIGNFYDDATTTIQLTGTAATNGCILINRAAYYFIDDVFVEAHIVLPLKQFQVKKRGVMTSLLSWEVSNIESYQEIRIQRGSDGIHFETIATLEELKSLQEWEDNNPLSGANYYRLEMVLKAEIIEHSAIKVLNHSTSNMVINVYPNPFVHQIEVKFEEDIALEALEIELWNSLGECMPIHLSEVYQNQKVKLEVPETLPKGMYWLRLKNGRNITCHKVLKD